MKVYNKIRNKILEYMDFIAVFIIILVASAIDSMTMPMILKAMSIPSVWLLARYIANN